MMNNQELELINKEIQEVKEIFLSVVKIIPSFEIASKKVLPYGLKAHTRSVSWIVEQVINQQAKFNKNQLNLDDVEIDMPDTCLHDCVIVKNDKRYFVNIKIHNADGKDNKNDIAAVEKLFMQYKANPQYRLIYACFGFRFDNLEIQFVENQVHTFSPQFLPIYVNPRNDKIQSYYHHDPIYRSREDFLDLLKENSKSIILN